MHPAAHPTRIVRFSLSGLLGLALLLSTALHTAAQTGPDGRELPPLPARLGGTTSLYLVELHDPPALRYEGGIAGLPATAPAATPAIADAGRRFDPSAPAVRRYVRHLEVAQDRALAGIHAAGVEAAPRFRYTLVRNGFALPLTATDAARVAALPGVARVRPDRVEQLLTLESVEAIGAPAVWQGQADPQGLATQGEGVVVGVIDSGLRFDHPAFSATPDDGYTFVNPFGAGEFLGWCDPAHPDHDPAYACSAKVLGAWDFVDGIEWSLDLGGGAFLRGLETDGPLDDNGHGSGVAGIAAGNRVEALQITGVAPRAQLIVYDACLTVFRDLGPFGWARTGAGVCPQSSTLASIEQAILDQVDVINYSISGGDEPWTDGDQDRLFLDAVAAGIVVAAGAGNAGPDPSSVSHLGPWVASVGATVKIEEQVERATLGGFTGGGTPPAPLTGAGLDPRNVAPAGVPLSDLVYAGDLECVAGPCVSGEDWLPEHCIGGYAPGALADVILVCDRREASPTESAWAGLPIYNDPMPRAIIVVDDTPGAPLPPILDVSPGSQYDQPPLLHLTLDDGTALKDWMAAVPRARATLGAPAPPSTPIEAYAEFTSRGPNRLAEVQKPDFAAPGRNILAPNRARQDDDEEDPAAEASWNGTSFASPHVAGAAALLRALHPDWSPPAILSALATTTVGGLEQEGTGRPATPAEVGSGRLDVAAAAGVGLVLDESVTDFLAADPADGGDPQGLNLPSFFDSDCVRGCSVRRTVTSVAPTSRTWALSTESPPGIAVDVAPSSVSLASGASAELTITVTVTPGVATPELATAGVVLDDGVSSPNRLTLALGATNGRIPERLEVEVAPGSGQLSLDGFGTRGVDAPQLEVAVTGAVTATVETPTLLEDPSPGDPFDVLGDVRVLERTVPAGARVLWVEVGPAGTAPGLDLDLYVGRDTNGDGLPSFDEAVCTSARSGAREQCLVDAPNAGDWWIVVQSFAATGPGGDDVTIADAVLPPGDLGDLVADAPPSAAAYTPFAVDLAYDLPALDASRPALAVLDFGTSTVSPDDLGSTLLLVRAVGAVDPQALFADGFESGDTSRWSP